MSPSATPGVLGEIGLPSATPGVVYHLNIGHLSFNDKMINDQMIKLTRGFFDPRLKRSVKLQKKRRAVIFYNPPSWRVFIFGLGTGAVFLGLIYAFYLYLPLAKALVSYRWWRWFHRQELARKTEEITPAPSLPTPTLPPVPDPSFSIFIPKINAQAKVFVNVDPGRAEIYQEILKEGVAHAAGTGFPGSGKTIYLFAHSTNAQWNVVRYNAVFFLLNQLEAGDEVWLVYNRKLYPYVVREKKVVEAKDTHYLTDYREGETLILQTCWPPGTILKRLLVFAKPKF